MKERRGPGSNSPRRGTGDRKKRTREREERDKEFALEKKIKSLEDWIPRTELGKRVKAGEVNSLEEIFEDGYKIMEPQIVDSLVKNLDEKLVDFKKTARVRMAGRQFSFRSTAIVGDHNKYIGVGIAKDKERFPSIRKATQNAKLNLVQVRKGCGSWECGCGTEHSVPFSVKGKCGSVRVRLLPAPKGTGLVIGDNAKDVLKFVGITDVWSQSSGATDTKLNFVLATIDALRQTTSMRLFDEVKRQHHKREEFSEEEIPFEAKEEEDEGTEEKREKRPKERGRKRTAKKTERAEAESVPLEFEAGKIKQEESGDGAE